MVFIWGLATAGNRLSEKRRKMATDYGTGEKKLKAEMFFAGAPRSKGRTWSRRSILAKDEDFPLCA